MNIDKSTTIFYNNQNICPPHITIGGGAVVQLVFDGHSTPDLNVDLLGDGGQCHLYYVANFTHNTHQCRVHFQHHAPNTYSQITARMLADGDGVGYLYATTTIHPKCDNAETKQDLKGLVMNKNAKIEGRPELFIHHDIVKAAHGCAIGGIDENQLFYIISRGIDRLTARQLLCDGFLGEIKEQISQL